MLARIIPLLFLLPACGQDFVLVREGTLPGRADVRVDAFEMAAHPVTNAEYKLFVGATGHAAPLHWESGRIPDGMENHPVIFVNRQDVQAYLEWRTRQEGRIYRLPTAAEFEYAARAGSANAVYPWGKESPEGRANYDPKGGRLFSEWRKYLQPVKSYPPNPWKLYDMSGNVWQMVITDDDPALRRFIYRLDPIVQQGNAVYGGSWARTAAYLRCSSRAGTSAGIRHPDLGFRVVREPAGAKHFQRQPRRVIAAPFGAGAVYLGWQLLEKDAAGVGFHVYRSPRRDAAGVRITASPVHASTNFVDAQAPASGRLYYRVRAVDASGQEGPPSEWAGITLPAEKTNLIAVFEPTVKTGGFVPVFGDLDGDGILDAVLRLNNGITEMSRDPGVPVELEAFTSYGRSLWRRPLVRHDKCFGSANNVPVALWDMDGDGKSEVICRLQEGETVYVAILDGMTGEVRRKSPWTPMATDFAKSSTRIHLAIAYLNGKTPAVVTQTGLYENEIFDAFDHELNKLWTFNSFAETNGSGSHHVDIADLDGDGRDEVLNGTTALNPGGTLRWSIYRQHPDIVAVKRILPGGMGRQVAYVVESSAHAGVYVVDASTGKIIWKVNREDDPRWGHGHNGWISDIWDGSPGMEIFANRDGHEGKDNVLFSALGKVLADPFPAGLRPVNWTGGATRELMNRDGNRLSRFDGKGVVPLPLPPPAGGAKGSCAMVADLAGDYRDELVCTGVTKEGNPAVFVYSNIEPAPRREVSRTESREYRLWIARNQGAGYGSYFEWEK